MAEKKIGLFGASSFVGQCLIPLLDNSDCKVTAYTRKSPPEPSGNVTWQQIKNSPQHIPNNSETIPFWIWMAPIWILPDYLDYLLAQGAKRVVILSTTSRFTKQSSSNPRERALVHRIAEVETHLEHWEKENSVEWIILRPTMIYGHGIDKNISVIGRFIHRFGFFPLFGKAHGLRQPVHAEDVASACLGALESPKATNRAYNISGNETLTYREMVTRLFVAMGKRPRLPSFSIGLFRIAVNLLRIIPRYRHWSASMAERMNQDLVFDHSDATSDFNYSPRPFRLDSEDIP